jgi:hypothetical protein
MTKPTGRVLNKKWGVGAQHALYSEKGTWYHVLERFPGALFDANGYILFESKRDYESCPQLNRGDELNVPGGIASIPGYVKKEGLTDSN